MEPRTHSDLEIEISRAGKDPPAPGETADYWVRFSHRANTNPQRVSCRFPPPVTALLAGAGSDNRKWRRDTTNLQSEALAINAADLLTLNDIGGVFFESLFPGDLAGEFRAAVQYAQADGQYGRLRLNLTDAPELARLPWEAVYWPGGRMRLATSDIVNIVRTLRPPIKALDRDPLDRTVQVLIAEAVPRDELDSNREILLIEERLQQIMRGDGKGPAFKVDLLRAANRTSLIDRLATFQPDIFHFIGHGDFIEGEGQIVLTREDRASAEDKVPAEWLRNALAMARPLRLVFLNSCQGAQADLLDPFGGVAQNLILGNMPFVIAMQFPISDEAALRFAEHFYGALGRGDTIDDAVTAGRRAIRGMGGLAQVELITPVLYMSGYESRLTVPASENGGGPPGEAAAPEDRQGCLTALLPAIAGLFGHGAKVLGIAVALGLVLAVLAFGGFEALLWGPDQPGPAGKLIRTVERQIGLVREGILAQQAGADAWRRLRPPRRPPGSPPHRTASASNRGWQVFPRSQQVGEIKNIGFVSAYLELPQIFYRSRPISYAAIEEVAREYHEAGGDGVIRITPGGPAPLAYFQSRQLGEALAGLGVAADAIIVEQYRSAGLAGRPQNSIDITFEPVARDESLLPATTRINYAPDTGSAAADWDPVRPELVARWAGVIATPATEPLGLRLIARPGPPEADGPPSLDSELAQDLIRHGAPAERLRREIEFWSVRPSGAALRVYSRQVEIAPVLRDAEDVAFAPDSYTPDEAGTARIAAVARWFAGRRGIEILLRGHAADYAARMRHPALATRRSACVARALIGQGVPAGAIVIQAGDAPSVVSPATGATADHRVEMILRAARRQPAGAPPALSRCDGAERPPAR